MPFIRALKEFCSSKIWHKWTYLLNRNGLTDIENRLVVAKGEGGGGGMGWESGISRCKLLYMEWINNKVWASLVAQWLRILLPMQGTRVRALVQEDPTCRGATKPMRHDYWACALEPTSHNCWACALEPMSHDYWARVWQLLKPVRLEPVLCNKRSHHNEKPLHHNEDPMQPKINK